MGKEKGNSKRNPNEFASSFVNISIEDTVNSMNLVTGEIT